MLVSTIIVQAFFARNIDKIFCIEGD